MVVEGKVGKWRWRGEEGEEVNEGDREGSGRMREEGRGGRLKRS